MAVLKLGAVDEQLKQRLVGAAVLVSLAVIFVPMVLETPSGPEPVAPVTTVPPRPKGEFTSKIVPLEAPETPLLDAQSRRREAEARSEAARDAATAAESGSPEAPAPAVEPTPVPSTTAVASVPAPATKPVEAPPAAQGESSTEPTAWAVQLGSFSSTQNAVTLRDRLRAKGYRAFVETARGDRGEITRVFVGPALGRSEAAETVDKLYGETNLKGIVVRYPGS